MEVKYNYEEIERLSKRIGSQGQFFSVVRFKNGQAEEIVQRTQDVAKFNDLADYEDNSDFFKVKIYKTGDLATRAPSVVVTLVVKGIQDGLGNVHSEYAITEKIKAELRKEMELEQLKKENTEQKEEIRNLLKEIGEKDEIIANGNMANLWGKGLGEAANIVLSRNPNLVGGLSGLLGVAQTAPAELSEEQLFLINLGQEVFDSFQPAQNFDFFKENILPFLKQDNLLLNDFYKTIQSKYGQSDGGNA